MIIGRWRVETEFNRIRCGGHVAVLEPKVMKLLIYFAAHQGEVIPRETLIHEVWGNVNVVPGVVGRAIYQLRKALESDGASFAELQTIPKRGYCLVESAGSGCFTQDNGSFRQRSWANISVGVIAAGILTLTIMPINQVKGPPISAGISLALPSFGSSRLTLFGQSSALAEMIRPVKSATAAHSFERSVDLSLLERKPLGAPPERPAATERPGRINGVDPSPWSAREPWPTNSAGLALPAPPAPRAPPAPSIRPRTGPPAAG